MFNSANAAPGPTRGSSRPAARGSRTGEGRPGVDFFWTGIQRELTNYVIRYISQKGNSGISGVRAVYRDTQSQSILLLYVHYTPFRRFSRSKDASQDSQTHRSG